MKHYYSLNEYLKNKYGCKVYKLSINGGMTCPNRDGKIDTRGCIFCSSGGSGEFATGGNVAVKTQLISAMEKVRSKTKDNAFIAYFQPYTNTYQSVEYLRKIFTEAIECDFVVGLAIATRPDCLDEKIVNMLSDLNKIKPIWVELGLQTIHPATAEYIRRGYSINVYEQAVEMLHNAEIEVVTHLILGLPDETEEMMLESVAYTGKHTDGIKLQLLHVIEGTDLAIDFKKGKFKTLSLEEYTDILCKAIELLPEKVVIHRITGDGVKKSLIAPLWSGDKKRVLNYINKQMDERKILQGKNSKLH